MYVGDANGNEGINSDSRYPLTFVTNTCCGFQVIGEEGHLILVGGAIAFVSTVHTHITYIQGDRIASLVLPYG